MHDRLKIRADELGKNKTFCAFFLHNDVCLAITVGPEIESLSLGIKVEYVFAE